MHTPPRGRAVLRGLLVSVMMLALSACQALDLINPVSAGSGPTPSSAELGQRLYSSSCKWCHGDSGERGAVPLRDAAPTMTDEDLANTIVNGDKDKGMPAHGSLTKEQVANLIAFIRSWQP